MFQKICQWINDRWPLSKLIRLSLEEEMVGGPSFAYVFGSCVLVIFLLQVVTGLWQLLYFVPTVGNVLGGPSPRPLDTLPGKIEDGILYVQWEQFRVGAPEKVAT
jgi:quinol-cytochrome oxidoreductase complex cytochrome b subunit